MSRVLLTLCAISVLATTDIDFAPAQQKSEKTVLSIVDGTGKEHKTDNWSIVSGTKHLAWLAGPGEQSIKGGNKKGPPQAGPEALEFSEGKVPPLKRRVVSYVPLVNIRSIDFEDKGNLISVRVVVSDKEADDVILHGVTGYAGVNAVIIDVTTDLGELGKGTIRFQHGVGRGLTSVRFPSPKPLEAPSPKGRVASLKQFAKNQQSYTVVDPEALYTFGTMQRTYPFLFFKDTVKLDLSKIQKLISAGPGGVDFDVTLTTGQQSSLTLLERPKTIEGKADMVLEGLVGRFDGGYRLIPMGSIGELVFEEKGK